MLPDLIERIRRIVYRREYLLAKKHHPAGKALR